MYIGEYSKQSWAILQTNANIKLSWLFHDISKLPAHISICVLKITTTAGDWQRVWVSRK